MERFCVSVGIFARDKITGNNTIGLQLLGWTRVMEVGMILADLGDLSPHCNFFQKTGVGSWSITSAVDTGSPQKACWERTCNNLW